MRRDYVEPDDFEYEPTPHDEVLKRAQAHKAAVAARGGEDHELCLDVKTGESLERSWNRPPVDRAGWRRRAARSRDGAASSFDARRLPDGSWCSMASA